jgi:hypothetical protein
VFACNAHFYDYVKKIRYVVILSLSDCKQNPEKWKATIAAYKELGMLERGRDWKGRERRD